MGKLHVWEETGEVRVPSRDEFWLQRDGSAIRATYCYDPEMKLPILRRLTDAEVEALVAPKPADDERERFVRETAARLIGTPVSTDSTGAIWYRNIEESIADAESLAARLWEKRS